jgi:hypothetical protein
MPMWINVAVCQPGLRADQEYEGNTVALTMKPQILHKTFSSNIRYEPRSFKSPSIVVEG